MAVIWQVFALGSALFAGFGGVLQKKALNKKHATEYSLSFSVLSALLALPLLLKGDFSGISFNMLALAYLSSILITLALLFINKGVRHEEVSLAVPFLSLTPAFTAIFAFLALGERISLMQIAGIFVVVLGSYMIKLKHNMRLLDPVREIAKSKYLKYVITGAFFYGITSVIDRNIVGKEGFNANPLTYLVILQSFIALNFLIIYNFMYGKEKGVKESIKNNFLIVFVISIFTVLQRVFLLEAFSIAEVARVIPIKRLSILIVVIVGGELFHEDSILRKVIATAIMIAGGIMVMV